MTAFSTMWPAQNFAGDIADVAVEKGYSIKDLLLTYVGLVETRNPDIAAEALLELDGAVMSIAAVQRNET